MGLSGLEYAIEESCIRQMHTTVEVKLVWAAQSVVPSTIGRFISPSKEFAIQTSKKKKSGSKN